MISAAAYCRVSTSGEDQINSFEAQKRYFTEYISRNEEMDLYRIYADEGISGTALEKRIQFQQMLSDARNGEFKVILTKEVSRFSRNILDTIACTRELKAYGVGVIFLNDGINSLDPDAELRLSIMASVAQEESRRTSERVKWGQLRQMEQGLVFGHSILGYNVERGQICLEPFGARIVKNIFEKYALGYSSGEIAAMLNCNKTPTSTGREWSAQTVLKLLKNEKYVGDLLQKKTYTPSFLDHKKKINHNQEDKIYIKNHHEAIIDRQLWNKVQLEIKKRTRKKGTQAISEKHLFSGKVFCAECGSVLVSRRRKREDGSTYIRWSCSANLRSKDICSFGQSIRDDELREMLIIISEDLRSLIHRACIHHTLEFETKLNNEKCSDKLSEQIKCKKAKALDMWISGLITQEEYDNINKKYDLQLNELEYHNIIEQKSRHLSTEEKLKYISEGMLYGKKPAELFWRNFIKKIVFMRERTVEIELVAGERKYLFKKE